MQNRAKKIDSRALTAQRLKRLLSIDTKLRRFPDMKLTQMQDIGGCRAVMKSIAEVDKLIAAYRTGRAKNPNQRQEFIHGKDYISTPKPDGYRSFHFVYKYHSRARKHRVYNGLKIEIQIRSQLQHNWATAVEIISTFTGQALKSNIGDETWKRFFKLMGSEIVLREKRPLVPDTPESREELVNELRPLVEKLQVQTVLSGFGAATTIISEGAKGAGANSYLLVLDSKDKTLRSIGFSKEDMHQAEQQYLELEKGNADNPWIQTVHVAVGSVAALRRAYPNYYLDSTAFLQMVQRAIGSTRH